MRSFTLSVFTTLAFAAFSYAAPMLGGAPVNAIVARGDSEPTEATSLAVVLSVAIDVMTPIAAELGKRRYVCLCLAAANC